MRKFILLLLCALLCAFAACAPAGEGEQPNEGSPAPATDAPDATTPPEGGTVDPSTVETMKATIVVKDLGTIELELYPSVAPQTVCNFVSLARQGLYDGLIFHRVISGFMVQGGDPLGTGMGSPGYFIKGEFSANGFENPISHERGVISMARRNSPYNSAGSQFFIMHQDYTDLDGGYAAFGRVTSGIEVVDAIAAVETDGDDKPLTDVVIESVTVEGPELPEPDKLPVG